MKQNRKNRKKLKSNKTKNVENKKSKKKQQEQQAQPEQKQTTQQQPNNSLPQGNYNFKSCKEAKAAGFSNIPKGHPAYSSNLDRDGDGLACDK